MIVSTSLASESRRLGCDGEAAVRADGTAARSVIVFVQIRWPVGGVRGLYRLYARTNDRSANGGCAEGGSTSSPRAGRVVSERQDELGL